MEKGQISYNLLSNIFYTCYNITICICRILRGWYPLTLDRSISWLIYLQVRLKIQELNVIPPTPTTQSSSTATAVVEDGVFREHLTGLTKHNNKVHIYNICFMIYTYNFDIIFYSILN